MLDAFFDTNRITYLPNKLADRSASCPEEVKEILNLVDCRNAINEIRQWDHYTQTPLLSFDGLARNIGICGIYYKDEGSRFSLNSFKSLGGAYAVLCLLRQEISSRIGMDLTLEDIRSDRYRNIAEDITVVTATDGNHGRSVAWGARIFGCNCVIYIHSKVSRGRMAAMEELGAKVVRVPGNYDDSVRRAAQEATINRWFIVSDTSYEGYTVLPRHVMAGYTVLFDEIASQLPKAGALSHTFVQGGVGGLAGAMCAYLWQTMGGDRPRFVVVEPDLADCLFQSAKNGKATEVNVTEETIMAGLSCGKVSLLAWQILQSGADDFMTIPDDLIAPTMRFLADGAFGAPPVVAGESAVAGLAALMAASRNRTLFHALGLDEDSQVLLIGTEGATDPEIYQTIVGCAASCVVT